MRRFAYEQSCYRDISRVGMLWTWFSREFQCGRVVCGVPVELVFVFEHLALVGLCIHHQLLLSQ